MKNSKIYKSGTFSSLFLQNDNVVNSTLLHEGIHLILGKEKGDEFIQSTWKSRFTDMVVDKTKSANISGKINSLCFDNARSKYIPPAVNVKRTR